MPRTLATFGLAVLVLVLAMLAPPPATPEVPSQPLDLQGITEVEVRSEARAGIRFSRTEQPSLELRDPEGRVEVRRSGHRLSITSTGHGYLDLWITLPETVDTLVVDGALVQSRNTRGPLEIRATGEVAWDGDATELRILDVRKPLAPKAGGSASGAHAANQEADECRYDCPQFINIQDGQIGRLAVDLPRGGLRIARADQLVEADVSLGPRAWLSIDHARDLGHIRVQHQEDARLTEGVTRE